MNIFDKMAQMSRSVPDAEKFVVCQRTFDEMAELAQTHFRLTPGPDERVVVQNFANIPIVIDNTVPPGQIYLLGRTVR